jgi:hypothetical protein
MRACKAAVTVLLWLRRACSAEYAPRRLPSLPRVHRFDLTRSVGPNDGTPGEVVHMVVFWS